MVPMVRENCFLRRSLLAQKVSGEGSRSRTVTMSFDCTKTIFTF